MPIRSKRGPVGLLVVLLLVWCPVEARAQTIRSGVTLVPVDLRVVDAQGNPVPNLTRADFDVYENDVLQEVAHFETVSFGDETEPPDTLGELTTPYRTFILLLGRGRLNDPAKALDGLIAFTRDALLPTDRIGIVAYLRASEPTTDHASVLRFLTAFRERHERLDHLISLPRGPNPTFPPSTRKEINDLFAAHGVPVFKDLPGGVGNVEHQFGTWTNLRGAIDDARRLPGEKHLIVVAGHGLSLAKIGEEGANNYWVRRASGARVALSYIHTGGTAGLSMSKGRINLRDLADSVTKDGIHRAGDHRSLAELTGGVSSFYSYASKPLDALDRASRVQYVLGYYPKADVAPDFQRRIRIVVKRRNLTLMYRHVYELEPPANEEVDFRTAAADERIESTLEWLMGPPRFLVTGQAVTPPRGIRLTTAPRPSAQPSSIVVRIALDPTRVIFLEGEGVHRANLDVGVVVKRSGNEFGGEWRGPIVLALSAAEVRRTQREWIEFDVIVPVVGDAQQIYAVVYQYESGRVSAGKHSVPKSHRRN